MKQIKKSHHLSLAFCIGLCSVFASSTGFAESNNIQQSSIVPVEKSDKSSVAQQFMTLTFHDVRDDVAKRGDRDVYAISTQNLAAFFAWIKREGWQPIRLEDVRKAEQQQTKLPEKALLLHFDDGALSSYSKVFPLLKQYNYPAVFAIVTSWVNGNTKDGYAAYGEGNLMQWHHLQEMQRSGLVEFASHSDNLHRGILSNPQQNMQPAAIARQYNPLQQNYENDRDFQTRIWSDLSKSKRELDRRLGTNTLAILWPYGAVTPETEALARKAGLPLSFGLGTAIRTDQSGQSYQRVLIMDNPTPEQIHAQMDDFLTGRSLAYKQRASFLQFSLSELQSINAEEFNTRLGQFLDQLNALKSSDLVLKVVFDKNADGKFDTAFFPNSELPMQQDLLNRTLWQAKTRIGNRVYAELPLSLQQQGVNLNQLTTDLMKNNSGMDGFILNVEDTLQCAVQQAQPNMDCQQQLQTVLQLHANLKLAAKKHANLSNDFYSALKLRLHNTELSGLKNIIRSIDQNHDFLQLSLDPVQHEQSFNTLLEILKTLNLAQRQRLIVNFDIDYAAQTKDWEKYLSSYALLRASGVQKIGLQHYQMAHGAKVHGHLYPALSLNEHALTYRDPYLQGELKK